MAIFNSYAKLLEGIGCIAVLLELFGKPVNQCKPSIKPYYSVIYPGLHILLLVFSLFFVSESWC